MTNRQRGFRAIPTQVADSLRAALGPDLPLIERWWNLTASDSREQINLVVPGKPAESRLLKVLSYADPLVQMPPTGKLPENVLADFLYGQLDPRVRISKQ